MDVNLEIPPHSPLETSRTFFDSAEASEALSILQDEELSVVYKSIYIHLGQTQDRIMSIKIYLKYDYTYENAGFCMYYLQNEWPFFISV